MNFKLQLNKMNTRKLFAKNLDQLLDRHGLPASNHGRVEAFSKLVNRPISTAHRWLKGEGIPDVGTLLELTQILSCSLDDLFTTKREITPNNTDEREFLKEGFYRKAVFFSDNGNVDIDIPANILLLENAPTSIGLFAIQGMEMSPYLMPDDRVIFDTDATEIRSGAVFVLRIGGHITVRRLRVRLDQRIDVLCENAQHPPEQVDASVFKPDSQAGVGDIAILGRVIVKVNFLP